MKTVYICDTPGLPFLSSDTERERLTPALPTMRAKKLDVAGVPQCPGWRAQYKNTFVVRSPIAFNFNLHTDGSWGLTAPGLTVSDVMALVRREGPYTFQFMFSELLFCEEPLVVSQDAPALAGRTFHKDVDFISGAFDIGRWFRPLNMAFQTLDEGPLSISVAQGDPLYFVKFHTEEELTLKKFAMTDSIMTLMNNILHVKESAGDNSARPLEFFYDVFTHSTAREKLLTEIKANLIN